MKRDSAAVLICMMLFSVPVAYAQSPTECAAQAQYHADSRSGTMGSAAAGSSAGLLLGAVAGGTGAAAVGSAAFGGVVGGARQADQHNIDYERAYRRCMYGLQMMR